MNGKKIWNSTYFVSMGKLLEDINSAALKFKVKIRNRLNRCLVFELIFLTFKMSV